MRASQTNRFCLVNKAYPLEKCQFSERLSYAVFEERHALSIRKEVVSRAARHDEKRLLSRKVTDETVQPQDRPNTKRGHLNINEQE